MRVDRIERGKCAIEGEVSTANGRIARIETEAALADILGESDDLRVDLSRVRSSNSVMLSLMLSWLRQARLAGRRLVFERVPPELDDLIRFTGLDRVLPTEAPAAQAGTR